MLAAGINSDSIEKEISFGVFSIFGHFVNRLRLKYGKFRFSAEWQVVRDLEDCCSWSDMDDILVGYKFHPERTRNPFLIIIGATPTRKRVQYFYLSILEKQQAQAGPSLSKA